MTWDHLSINKPHLVYIILGGFTSLFMLCSSFIKERLYIGEATVATVCGIIFGPHAANLIDPRTWGNVDQITLEFSRIVLVVQCFAVGVELPKYYMEKHWRSVTFLLIPVMTFGWLVTSLFVWWMVPTLNWLESLVVASCVTATDPVLASSVVGKGKFAKRVPKHLRDLLSAESGCNDGMAFPFVYLGLYILNYMDKPNEVALNWIVVTILYECVFGAIYGFTVGYIGRRGIRWAEKHDLIDRESFLVFYFVLALFCAGSGSMLGVDDLLVGFAAGVGFSNDGWFTQKTEESHVSNVIDLLLNLAYFVYFGTIVPWEQFNAPELGTTAWRLVIIAIFVILFRRIPIMLALKPVIPDIKSWREALFAGHFGPIGVGAIFVAILARAELETGGATPLAELPPEDTEHFHLIALIWPITTFLVITSIIVHGSSIAVFTLGKHINTLSLTMSYTTAHEDGPSWMNRLPRISSQSKSMSKMSDTDVDELKMEHLPPGSLPPIGIPGTFLKRQKEEDAPTREGSRTSSLIPKRRKKRTWDSNGFGPGGPVSQSAITPLRRTQSEATSITCTPENNEDKVESPIGDVQHGPQMEAVMTRGYGEADQHKSDAERNPSGVEIFEEGDDLVFENEDGEVLSVQRTPHGLKVDAEEKAIKEELKEGLESPALGYKNLKKKLDVWMHKDADAIEKGNKPHERKRGAALAYQFGNTIIVEDEDGEVVKKYDLPSQKAESSTKPSTKPSRLAGLVPAMGGSPKPPGSEAQDNDKHAIRQGINRMGNWTGLNKGESSTADPHKRARKPRDEVEEDDDARIRFTIGGAGRRMTKNDFINEIRNLDAKTCAEIVESSNASAAMKDLARKDANPNTPGSNHIYDAKHTQMTTTARDAKVDGAAMAKRKGSEIREESEDSVSRTGSSSSTAATATGVGKRHAQGFTEFLSNDSRDVSPLAPLARPAASSKDFKGSSAKLSASKHHVDEPETATERRRREEVLRGVEDDAQETPAERRRKEAAAEHRGRSDVRPCSKGRDIEEGETPAERRRRIAALGTSGDDSDDESSLKFKRPALESQGTGMSSKSRGIRFADDPRKK